MKSNTGDRTHVTTLKLRHAFHFMRPARLEVGVQVRISAVFAGPRCLSRSCPCLAVTGDEFLRAYWLLFGVVLNLIQLLLQRLGFGRMSVTLKAHQCLLLCSHLVLVPELSECRLVLLIVAFQPLEINDEPVLLLHDTPMMHSVKVAF